MNGHLGDALSGFLDGELDAAALAALQQHLAACPVCAAELRATSQVRMLVRAMPLVDPPLPLTIARLEPRLPRPLAWVAAAAAVAAGVVALVVMPGADRSVTPAVDRFVEAHSTSPSAGDPVSGLAPVAVNVGFGP